MWYDRKSFLAINILVFSLIAAFRAYTYPDVNIDNISVISNSSTQSFIILQELVFRKNTVLTSDQLSNALARSEQNLKNLGIFGETEITVRTNSLSNVQKGQPVPVDVTVRVVDKWTLFPIPYYFYNTSDGHIFGFNLAEMNLFGLDMDLSLDGRYETIPDYKHVSVSYNYPRMFGSYFLTKLDLDYYDYIDAKYQDAAQVFRSRFTSLSLEWKTVYQFTNDVTPFSAGLKTMLQMQTDKIEMNVTGTTPNDQTSWYILAGMEQGVVNGDSGMAWGDDNNLWLGISPLDGSVMAVFQHAKYFTVFGRDVFAYRLSGSVTPNWDKPLDTGEMRGILLGEVRGNYIFYANAEFRKFIVTIPWPTVLDFYVPVFADAGNGFTNGSAPDIGKTMMTAGIGLRFYPRYLGGRDSVLRFDFGVSVTKLINHYAFGDYFYFGADFSDVF